LIFKITLEQNKDWFKFGVIISKSRNNGAGKDLNCVSQDL
jgi:hypothetical protein